MRWYNRLLFASMSTFSRVLTSPVSSTAGTASIRFFTTLVIDDKFICLFLPYTSMPPAPLSPPLLPAFSGAFALSYAILLALL